MDELKRIYREKCEAVQRAADAIDQAADGSDLDALRAALDDAVADAERAQRDTADAERVAEARGRFEVLPAAAEPKVRVGDDPEVYHPESQSFFSDMYRRQFLSDRGAAARLERHFAQAADLQRRDASTAAFEGLVVPQYLIDQFAPVARAGRIFANRCTPLPLPAEGMTINIPRGTTGTTAAAQATENSAISETDFDDTLLTINVRTYAGQQDVSRQVLERGAPGIDAIIFADLLADYHTKLNTGILSGAGTSGTHLGVFNVAGINAATYTASPGTVPGIYPKLADAIQQIASGRFLPATAIFMHPRRWGWFTAALDTANRPLVVPTGAGPYMAAGVSQAVEYGGPVGELQGLPVYSDACLPTNLGVGTNEDIILIVREPDMLLWEEGDGTPRQARFDETAAGSLTVKLVLYGYSAFAGGRYPESAATVGGTGLVTPTF